MTRFDRWSRDGMPDAEQNARIQRGIDATMRDIVANPRIPQSASMIPARQLTAEEQRPANGGGEIPLTTPSGMEWCDRLVDAQDRRDKLAAIQQAAENAEIERRLDRSNSYRAKTEYNPFDKDRI